MIALVVVVSLGFATLAGVVAWLARQVVRLRRQVAGLPRASRLLAREERDQGMDGLKQAVAVRTEEALVAFRAHEDHLVALLRAERIATSKAVEQAQGLLRQVADLREVLDARTTTPEPSPPAEPPPVARPPLASRVTPSAVSRPESDASAEEDHTRVGHRGDPRMPTMIPPPAAPTSREGA